MRKQQRVWENEHATKKTLPSMATEDPSTGVVKFIDHLTRKGVKPPLKVIDIGCGKGRNAIYLAKKGFEVYAVDYIQNALSEVENKVKGAGKLLKIHLTQAEIDRKWPFPDNFFDIAIDSFSSIDIETRKGREVYKKEMFRTLKPGGYALVMVVSADDEWDKELIKSSPGKEKNSTIWPQNGKFQKDYDGNELREFYQDFQILELREIKHKAFKLGRNYTATNYWVILRK